MATDADPRVGNWYRHTDKGRKFEVVALDEDNRVVEIQHFDGDLEEIALDDWYALDIEPMEAPADWTGPLSNVERDDLDTTETGMDDDDWASGTREWPARREAWQRKEPGEERDEWGDAGPQEEPLEPED